MVGRQLLCLVILASSVTAAGAASCSPWEANLGCIDADIDGGSVNLGGSVTSPGGSDLTFEGGGSTEQNPNCEYVLQSRCNADGPPRWVVTPVVTLADIASFRPTAVVHGMEPDGWAVVGLATNFYASGGAHVREGTLLGRPASVRFTPVAWHWDYGDGTSATRGTGGASWASLGIPEFESTPTSHVYRSAGTFTIRLSVEYSAEYRVGDAPWARIAGTLGVPADPLRVVSGDATTVLVGRDCEVNPAGAGC